MQVGISEAIRLLLTPARRSRDQIAPSVGPTEGGGPRGQDENETPRSHPQQGAIGSLFFFKASAPRRCSWSLSGIPSDHVDHSGPAKGPALPLPPHQRWRGGAPVLFDATHTAKPEEQQPTKPNRGRNRKPAEEARFNE